MRRGFSGENQPNASTRLGAAVVMEAGCSRFRTAMPVTDGSCKSSPITSSGDLPLITSSDGGRPQVPPSPSRSSMNHVCEPTRFFLSTGVSPELSQRPSSVNIRPTVSLFFFPSRSAHLFARPRRRVQRADASCVGRRGGRIFADRTCGSVSKYPGAEGETLNICHGGAAEKSPSKARGLGSGPPESAPCHLLGARLSPSVSLLHECLHASSSPPPQHSRSLLLLAALFRRGRGWGRRSDIY